MTRTGTDDNYNPWEPGEHTVDVHGLMVTRDENLTVYFWSLLCCELTRIDGDDEVMENAERIGIIQMMT